MLFYNPLLQFCANFSRVGPALKQRWTNGGFQYFTSEYTWFDVKLENTRRCAGSGGETGCVSMFPSLYVPRSLCSPVLYFPVSMFPGPMFPGIYVPHYLCSPVSMFPRPMFPSIYAPQYLCSPVPMSPSTYVPQYLCSPVPIFPISHNKRLRDPESVISVIFTLSSVRMSVHPFKVFTIALWVLISWFKVVDTWSWLIFQGHRSGS